jgi:hypothetical protein
MTQNLTTNTSNPNDETPGRPSRRERRAADRERATFLARLRGKFSLRVVVDVTDQVPEDTDTIAAPTSGTALLSLPAPLVDEHGFPIREERGWVPPRKKLRARMGYYEPAGRGAPSTSRQVEILNTAVVAAPIQFQGLLSGVETLSSTPSVNDQFEAYRRNLVESPNVCTIGDVGVGKSTLMKCDYTLRPLTLKGRRVVVIDIKAYKSGADYGEYGPVAAAIGVDPVRFAIGDPDGSTLNLLDPMLRQTQQVPSITGMVLIVQQAAAVLNDNMELDRFEKKAIRVAVAHAAAATREAGRTPTILDVIEHLGNVDVPEFAGLPTQAKDTMFMAGYGAQVLLERLPEEMPGLFDGDTSTNVRLDNKATFFDFSQLPEDGPARSIGMMLANAWTLGSIRAGGTDWQTNFCVDEGWFLVGGPMGKVIRSNSKLSRSLGLSNVVNIHHVADIPQDDPAIAFIKEAGTLHLFRQSKRDDAETAAAIGGLRPGAVEFLMTLPKGQHFKKVGIAAETRVAHTRSDLERLITDTTHAMGTRLEQVAA